MKLDKIFIFCLLICINIKYLQAQEPKPEEKQQQQKNDDTSQQNKKIKKTKLYNSPECHEEIVKYCPRGRNIELSDVSVLQCIYNELKDLSVLDIECQHVNYKKKKINKIHKIYNFFLI
jgi:hypothetical protein